MGNQILRGWDISKDVVDRLSIEIKLEFGIINLGYLCVVAENEWRGLFLPYLCVVSTDMAEQTFPVSTRCQYERYT